MKHFLEAISVSIVGWIVVSPMKAVAGSMLLLGVGTGSGAILAPPSITPQPSAAFSQAQGAGLLANNVLLANGGTSGAFFQPSSPTNSFVWYVEGNIDPNISTGTNYQYALGRATAGHGLLVTSSGPGSSTFVTQTGISGVSNANWWLGLSDQPFGFAPGATAGTGYLEGYWPFTASGGNCAREPSGVWYGGNGSAKIYDPGFMCQTTPTVSVATIPGDGAKQTTGIGTPTSCTSNSPASGEKTVTTSVTVAHGITPGQTYALSGFSPTGYNATYTALQGTTGTTLVGVTTTGGGTCPAVVTAEGSALSGTGGAVTLTSISTTTPFSADQRTGITAQPGGHFCGVVGEYGAESSTPGFQFASFTDREGNALPGSPGGRQLAEPRRDKFHRLHGCGNSVAFDPGAHRDRHELIQHHRRDIQRDDPLRHLHYLVLAGSYRWLGIHCLRAFRLPATTRPISLSRARPGQRS